MNKSANLQSASRREFLRGTARYGSLSLLAAMVGWNLRPGRVSEDCPNEGLCGGCPAFTGCRLPPAVARKGRSKGG